ncbi:MAG: hypothetical protein ABH820_02570 [Patescibacteria group bacterium]|nr:hypothetical protein [Patescibacteria group bacterium]
MALGRTTRNAVALITTLLIVGALVLLTYMNSDSASLSASIKVKPTGVNTETAHHTAVLMVDDQGARIFVNGSSRELTWPDDIKLLGQPLSTLQGRDTQTGEPVYLTTDFKRAPTSLGMRSPDGRRTLHPAQPKEDGTGIFEIGYGDDKQSIVVRTANGQGVKDVLPIGWWDSETVALLGLSTSSRAIFAVNLTGGVRQVANFPDTAERAIAWSGNVWYVTATLGQGLEDPLGPPSELHQVSFDGTYDLLSKESGRVIQYFVPSPNLQVAYQTEDGQITLARFKELGEDEDRPSLPQGQGMPLGFLDEFRLVVRKGDQLLIKDIITGREDAIADLSSTEGAVFMLTNPYIDEIIENL